MKWRARKSLPCTGDPRFLKRGFVEEFARPPEEQRRGLIERPDARQEKSTISCQAGRYRILFFRKADKPSFAGLRATGNAEASAESDPEMAPQVIENAQNGLGDVGFAVGKEIQSGDCRTYQNLRLSRRSMPQGWRSGSGHEEDDGPVRGKKLRKSAAKLLK